MSIAAAASAVLQERRKRPSKAMHASFAHLQEEKKNLEHELTTRLPAPEDIIFDKDLELLMMDG
jgi:hypothetical protein